MKQQTLTLQEVTSDRTKAKYIQQIKIYIKHRMGLSYNVKGLVKKRSQNKVKLHILKRKVCAVYYA